MSFEYVRSTYDVPACIGRRVTIGGKPGIIAADRGHYIGVTFDTETGVYGIVRSFIQQMALRAFANAESPKGRPFKVDIL